MIKRFNKKGFTLVEIIVVLVILAILAAIAVPSVLGYVEEAKKEKYKEKYNPDILFVNGSATRLSDRSLRRIIDRYAVKAGIEREISPYSFRHTFAVHMLSHGMDILYLKELMGHVTLESTKVYQELIKLKI